MPKTRRKLQRKKSRKKRGGRGCGFYHGEDFIHWSKIKDHKNLENELLSACKDALKDALEGNMESENMVKLFAIFKKGFYKAHENNAADYYTCLLNDHYFKKVYKFKLPNWRSAEAMVMGFGELNKKLHLAENALAGSGHWCHNALMSFELNDHKNPWREIPVFDFSLGEKEGNWKYLSVCDGDSIQKYEGLSDENLRKELILRYKKQKQVCNNDIFREADWACPGEGGGKSFRKKKKRKRTKKKRKRKKKRTRTRKRHRKRR